MLAISSRNPLLDRRGFGPSGPKSPFPMVSPRILLDRTLKQENGASSPNVVMGTPNGGRARALSDPPPSSDSKLLRSNLGRSNFDLEPNPFEQSFSSSERSTARDPAVEQKPAVEKRRARSQSPSGLRTPGGSNLANKLPPLNTIASPQFTGSMMHHFGWNHLDHTLRSGPLSPAMLHGPTPGSVGFSSFSNLFDPSSFRTGLTPSVTGQPGGVTYAPPSPATQALFAMMTNATDTPNVNGQTSGAAMKHSIHAASAIPGFQSERDLPNHFDLGFKNVLEGKPIGTEAMTAGIPIIDPASSAMPSMAPMFPTQPAPKPIGIVPAQPSPLKNTHQPNMGFAPGAIHPAQMGGFPGGQNPLYLLTQAQQEMHDHDDQIAAGVLSNLNTTFAPGMEPESVPTMLPPQAYTNGLMSSPISSGSKPPLPDPVSAPNTRKRKATAAIPTVIDDEVPIPPPAPRGRKKGTGKKQKVHSDDDDDDGDGRPRKPETEEEKRKNFLERNRQAALKCRQRKKAWLSNLQAKVEYLTADNETLQTTVQALREEISSLRTLLIAHKDCPAQPVNGLAAVGNTMGDFLAASSHPLPERPQPPPQTQFT